MINVVPFLTIFRSTKFFISGLLLFILAGTGIVNGATRYSVANGNWNATATWAATSGGTAGQSAPVAGDIVFIEGNHIVTITTASVCTNVTIASGSTLNVGAFNFTVSGTTTVSGTINYTGTAGIKTFTGLVTFSGTWNNAINAAITFQGGITNNGVFTAGSGIYTFNTNSQTLSGTWTIPSVTVTGITLTNNGTLTVGTALIGTGGITQGLSTSILNIGGTSGITTLNASMIGNTVNYTGGVQTVKAAATYHHLTLSGSGAKTLGAGTTAVNGNFTMAGTATATAAIGLTIGGNVTLGSGTTVTSGNFTHNVAGNWTNNGGTFTPGTGTVRFTGNSSAINGTAQNQSFRNIIVAKTAGQTLSVGGSTTTLNVGGTFIETTGNFIAPPTMSVTGALVLTVGTFTAGTNLTASGAWTNNGGIFTPGAGTVTFTGNTTAINGTAASQTFNNIILSKATGQTLSVGGSATTLNVSGTFTETTGNFTAPATMAVSGNLILTGGTFRAGANISVSGNWTNNGGTFTPGTGTITFLGNSTAINGTVLFQAFYNITVAKTAGQTLSVGSSTGTLAVGGTFTQTTGNFNAPATMTIAGNLTLTTGTFTAGTNLTARGNWTNNGGTFLPRAGTVTFNGIATAINGSAVTQTFNNIVSAKNTGTALSVNSGTLNVGGTFTETSGNFIAPATMLVSGNMTFTTGTFVAGVNLSVSGNWTRNGGTFTPGSGTVTFSGNNAAINGTIAAHTFNNIIVAKTADQTLSVGGGTTTLTVGGTYTETTGNFTALANMTVTGNLTLTTGTFTAGTNLTARANWTNNGGTFVPGTGTVTFSVNSAAINGTAASQTFNNIIVSKTTGQTLSVGGNTTTLNIGGNFTETTGNFTAPAAMTVAGNLIFTAGTFTSGANLSTSGNWNKNGGAFIAGTGTVAFNGAAETIGGSTSTTFNNLTLGGTGVKTFARTSTSGGSFSIINGLTASLGTGLTHTSGTLLMGGTGQSAGSWGGTGSAATNKNSTYFASATGILSVTSSSSCTAGSWTGATSTDWNTATNWCNGTVPTSSTNVLIPSGGNQPIIGAVGGICNNITINSGATLSITGSGSMTVSGSWTNNGGTFAPGTGSVTFNGSSSVINGTVAPQTFYNVNVSKTTGQTLSIGGSTTTLNVSNDLTISTGALTIPPGALLSVINASNLNSNPSLVLKSDATLTGSFIYNTFSGIGTVKVERFMSKSDNWHLYSSPIKDQSVHDFLKFNPEIPDLLDGSNNVIGVGMRDYITATDIWNPYLVYATASTTAGSIGGGKGFSIRTYNDTQGTGSIDATGTPNLNTVIVTLTRSPASTDKGWNCIGNPYLSALNIIGFLTANSAQLESGYEAVYIWDTNNIIPGKSSPDYVALNNASSISNVQIAQGFFVKSKSGGGTVSFTKTMQNPSAVLTFKDAEIEWPSLKIIATNQTASSSTEIKFITYTTKGLDPGYDAGMLKANPDFSLYSRLVEDVGIDFTLQCLPDQNYDQYEIPIGIDCKAGGELTFTAESVNLPAGCLALFEDRTNKTFTRLDLKDAKYTANVSADTKGTGRFFLHTSDVLSSVPKADNQSFKVYVIGKTVYVNGEVSANAQFFVYSVNGKLLANFKAGNHIQNQLDAAGLPAGLYVLTIVDKNLKKSVKFIIES